MTSRSSCAADRLQLGGAAVLSPTRAAELLPVRESDALRWLRERGLVRAVAGLGDVVVWGDVVEAIRAGVGPTEQDLPVASPRERLRRGSI